MFTGIVQRVGEITQISDRGGDLCLSVNLNDLCVSNDVVDGVVGDDNSPTGSHPTTDPILLGESIAVSGVCLTVTSMSNGHAEFDVSAESLSLTHIGQWQIGTKVNLERALLANTRMGGHFVSGHVDGLGRLVSLHGDGRSTRMTFAIPRELSRFVAPKGSITIDGVSLTVNGVEDARSPTESDLFDVNLVPHTLAVTTLGKLAAGHQVHLEIDVIARYLARLGAFDSE